MRLTPTAEYEDEDGNLVCPAEGCRWGKSDDEGCGLAKLGVPYGHPLESRCGAVLFVDGLIAEGHPFFDPAAVPVPEPSEGETP